MTTTTYNLNSRSIETRTTYILKARSGRAVLAFDNLTDALEAKAMREEIYRTTLTLVEQTITEKEIAA